MNERQFTIYRHTFAYGGGVAVGAYLASDIALWAGLFLVVVGLIGMWRS